MNIENIELACKYEKQMDFRKWADEIPFLKFPEKWEIQISPPWGGAVVRFRIKCGKAHVSIYLDCYENLGYVGQPYWEIYPYSGDTYRCFLNETDELLKAISESIEQQNNGDKL